MEVNLSEWGMLDGFQENLIIKPNITFSMRKCNSSILNYQNKLEFVYDPEIS